MCVYWERVLFTCFLYVPRVISFFSFARSRAIICAYTYVCCVYVCYAHVACACGVHACRECVYVCTLVYCVFVCVSVCVRVSGCVVCGVHACVCLDVWCVACVRA